jgi:hypothetical protein
MGKDLAIPSKELALKIVGPVNSFMASRIQRLNINKDVPATYVDELGNSLHVGQVRDIPNVTLTFSALDVGIRLYSVLTGTDSAAYPGAGVDISELGQIDAIIYIKDDSVSDYVKSAHARRLQVRDFTYSYSVDGDSTEDYTAVGSEMRWFKNDIVVDLWTTGTTSFSLSETPITLKNGNELLSFILDEIYLTEVAAGPATGEYSVSGTTVTTFDSRVSQALGVYHADPAGNNWSDVSDTISAVAVRGQDIDIEIGTTGINRVQSVTINGNLQPQDVRELGSRTIVGYQRQVPTVEGTLTVLDTDTDLLELLTTGTITASGGDTEFETGVGCVTSGIDLEIKILDPCDTTVPYTVLKTVHIPSLIVNGDSLTSNVNNNAVQTFNWRSETGACVVYSGAM